MYGWLSPGVRLMTPSVTAAIRPIPDESPSSPSMKLMLLIIPAIHRTLNATAIGVTSRTSSDLPAVPDPSGLAMNSTTKPVATANSARPSWPANCQRARRSSASSITPKAVASRPPRSRPTRSTSWTLVGTGANCTTAFRESSAIVTLTNAIATATPPPRGTGVSLTRRSSGWSIASNRIATRRTSGVSTNETAAAATSARMRYGTVGPALSANIRPGWSSGQDTSTGGSSTEARHREATADRRDPACERRLGRRIGALLDRVGDERCDLAHLAGAHSPRGHRGRPDPDPRRRVGRLLVERDLVLVDRDPDLVEEVLGLLAGHAARRDVDEHQVVVRAARHDPQAALG